MIANSGAPIGFDYSHTLTADSPPLLLFLAQHDLTGAILAAPMVRELFEDAGATLELAWVPGFGHFYPRSATTLGADGTRMSLDGRAMDFLERALTR